MEPRSPGGVEGGGGGRDADRPPPATPEPGDARQRRHDDDHDLETPGPPPASATAATLSLDQIRVASRRSNDYTDGPTLGARWAGDPPAPGSATPPSPHGPPPPPVHRCSLTPCSSSPSPVHGSSLSSLQRLVANDDAIRTQPKRGGGEFNGEERKPLTAATTTTTATVAATTPGPAAAAAGGGGGGGPHSRRCASCGRCVCGECTRPRALPSCWLCGRRCACSAQGVAEAATCVCCVRALFYHCSSDDEDTCAEKPFSCTQAHCAARWAAVALLALPLPCIACYPLARGCAAGGQRCYDAAARPGCRCQGGGRRRKGGGGGGGGKPT